MNKTAILIDDEKRSIDVLKKLLENYCPGIQVLGQANGVSSGLKLVQELQPELIFLDIQMADGTGFDLLEDLDPECSSQVIFVTAYDQYALKAFRFCALDYLLKPLDPDLLKEAVEKLNKTSTHEFSHKIKILQNNLNGQKKIVLPSKEEYFVTEINEVIRCEANGNYTIFYLRNRKPILVSKTLKEFEELLSEFNFLRIHKSHLINIEHVERYLPKDSEVIMSDSSVVELSRRKKDLFLSCLYNQ